MKTIAIAGTFDTKGEEFLFAKTLVEKLGMRPYMIHTGVYAPAFRPDVTNDEVAAAAGYSIREIAERGDRALATAALSEGMRILVPRLYRQGVFDGIVSFGGSGGTALVTPAMRALPIGVPKVMVSTMASGDVSAYVGESDIVMIPSVVDVAGLNRISRKIFRNAVCAAAGMAGEACLVEESGEEKPLIGATMFGVTTPCVKCAKEFLEKRGFEVLVFHANGSGGRTMESLIGQGYFAGILDLTTTEWCDEVAGGVMSAGPDRCGAAILAKMPQVVSVGACDMVDFGPIDTVPERFAGRNLYRHNPAVTLMRTTVEENIEIGRRLAAVWNRTEVPMELLLPLKGVSMIDAVGQPFDGPAERAALFCTLKEEVRNPLVRITELDCHINDTLFAETAARKLCALLDPVAQPRFTAPEG